MNNSDIKYEIIGHILVVRAFSDKGSLYHFAKNQLESHPHLKTIAIQTEKVNGIDRVPTIKYFMGENKFETLHKEYGNRFLLDPSKMFFSPRLSYERQRIAKVTKKNDIVLNFFSGVGPFSICIASCKPKSVIHSIEINPFAYEYLLKNISLNKCTNQIIPYLGDAFEIVPEKLLDSVKRVILPLPLKSKEAFPLAYRSLKNGEGVIHWQISNYIGDIENKNDLLDLAHKELKSVKSNNSLKFESSISKARIIRSLSPNIAHIAVDVLCT